jgi:hypothetical protein
MERRKSGTKREERSYKKGRIKEVREVIKGGRNQ